MTDEIWFRPSSMDRIIACPPSVIMSAGAPKRQVGQAARDGTAAHFIAEMCLTQHKNASEFIDRGIDIGDGKSKVFLDEEDCEHVQFYVDYVREHAKIPNSTLHVEYKLSMSTFTSDPLLSKNGGTADAVILDWDNDILYIDDLKFGRGIMVSGASYQLRNYALMASLTFKNPRGWKKIVTTIIQPRSANEDERIKPVEHTPVEIQNFLFLMYDAFKKSQDPNTPLNPGEKQCFWCDGRGKPCPALAKKMLDMAANIFGDDEPITLSHPLVAAPVGDMNLTLQRIAEATPQQLADWKSKEELVNGFFKGVSERISNLLTAGTEVPGWKLVSRTGNRRWRNEVDVAGELAALGVKPEQMYAAPKFLGPAPIEKLLKGDAKKKLSEFYERPLGEPVLVKDSDERTRLTGVFDDETIKP